LFSLTTWRNWIAALDHVKFAGTGPVAVFADVLN
jgi:hypothetical protein